MKPFIFQQFSVQQHEEVFRVGTDAVLLGALASVEHRKHILEVGSGTGIVSLMLAQRNSDAHFTAIDIDETAATLTKTNFSSSPFSQRMKAVHQDFNEFEPFEKFDLIISNPPYFEENQSEKDVLARQKITLNFQQLIAKSTSLLSENGWFTVILPSDFFSEFHELAEKEKFFLAKKTNIFGIENGKLKRHILEFSKNQETISSSDFYIEKSPRKYSDHYLEVTKDFHVFKK